MEIGLRNEIPTYAGGLGILAGDVVRSSADLKLPLVAVVLVSKKNHFKQEIKDGKQIECAMEWNPSKLMTTRAVQGPPLGEDSLILDLIHEVSQAAGIAGMVGGQAVDIESEGKIVDLPTLQYIHTHKTGALILVSVRVGVKLGSVNEEALKAFTRYGERIGLAFQIADDILNVEGKAVLLGKKTGSDLSKGKATYPSLFGLQESKKRAKELVGLAVEALSPFGSEADPLREIARFIVAREY
jgi:geranylgeranyl diphosphate synthase type II